MKHSNEKITSPYIAPWLINIVYPLGSYIVLPFYFGQINISGQENIPKSGPVIVAPTHRSRWDALIVPYATGKLVSNRHLYFMVTKNEMQGIQGCLIRRLGGFPVNINNPGLATFRHSIQLLKEEKMLAIFPEGGIVTSQEVQPLKEGIARIALGVLASQADSPIKILPISVKYSQEIPSFGCDVEVKIGTCLNVSEYNQNSRKQEVANLTQDLENRLKQLHQRQN